MCDLAHREGDYSWSPRMRHETSVHTRPVGRRALRVACRIETKMNSVCVAQHGAQECAPSRITGRKKKGGPNILDIRPPVSFDVQQPYAFNLLGDVTQRMEAPKMSTPKFTQNIALRPR